jgi:hypothetical protein
MAMLVRRAGSIVHAPDTGDALSQLPRRLDALVAERTGGTNWEAAAAAGVLLNGAPADRAALVFAEDTAAVGAG